jgi:hypothetical protein
MITIRSLKLLIFSTLVAIAIYIFTNSFLLDGTSIGVPSRQFPTAAFKAVKNPFYKYGLLNERELKKSEKIYKSIVPLRTDGRYEIKGGEFDWQYYSFNGEIDIVGNGLDGIAKEVITPKNFPRNAAVLAVSHFNNLKTGCYALYDLNADGMDEIIVQSGHGSSGAQYAFLEKQHGKWKIIESFAGGFVLTSLNLWSGSKKYSNDYWYVTHWWSSGNEFVQSVDAYRNGEYEVVSSQSVPFAVRELDFGLLNSDASC